MSGADFPWRPGMLSLSDDPARAPLRVLSVEPNGAIVAVRQGGDVYLRSVWWFATNYGIPDLTDGPTKGALLEAVREAYGDPTAYVMPEGNEWAVWAHIPGDDTPGKDGVGDGPTEGDALLAAWEARPR